MNKKRIAAFLAAAILLTGCAKTADTSSDSSTAVSEPQTAETENAATKESETAENEESAPTVLSDGYADLDTVIASGDKGEPVTFGEFIKEYKYFLSAYGMTDDTNENYADILTQRREYTVNYLINAKIISDKFAEYYPEGFSEEELAQIQQDHEQNMNSILASFGAGVYSENNEISQEDLLAQAQQKLDEVMEYCGLTEDDFYSWERETAEQTKVMEYVTSDVSVERSEAEEQTAAAANTARESYESDPAGYDADSNANVFIPEGSRNIKHILLKLSDEDIQQIYQLRNEGKDDEADALREEKLAELSDKLSEVQGKIAEGEDFETLMAEYSGDGDVTATYLITPGTERYMEGFAETALAIPEVGGTDACATDYGWHIIKYIEPAVLSEEDYQKTVDEFLSYLIESRRNEKFSDAVKQWREEYNYTIDRELLLLGAEE